MDTKNLNQYKHYDDNIVNVHYTHIIIITHTFKTISIIIDCNGLAQIHCNVNRKIKTKPKLKEYASTDFNFGHGLETIREL